MEPRYDLIGGGWAGELAKPRPPRGEIVIADGCLSDVVTTEIDRRRSIADGARALVEAVVEAYKQFPEMNTVCTISGSPLMFGTAQSRPRLKIGRANPRVVNRR